jgi:hypothetical protein
MDQRDLKLAEFDSKFEGIQSFFDVPVVKNHLIIMKAFTSAAESIDKNFAIKDPKTGIKSASPPMEKYLSQAVYRYYLWITKVLKVRKAGPLVAAEIPPLDVLSILHGHMIAPSCFDKDVDSKFSQLGSFGAFPFSESVRLFFSFFCFSSP